MSYKKSDSGATSRIPLLWLSPEKSAIVLSLPVDNRTWVLANTGSTGYYRVEYDPVNWQLLGQQLVADHSAIDSATRAQLVDDAFTLARADAIPYQIAFDLIAYLRNVSDVHVRLTALQHIIDISITSHLDLNVRVYCTSSNNSSI